MTQFDQVVAAPPGRFAGIERPYSPEDVLRLLREKPEARGLAVPGMPVGSPGMEGGGKGEPFDVLLFTADGTWKVFASH